ncbi:MAG: hypothetical protein R2911_32495 [Caldilineaceae bacterium]
MDGGQTGQRCFLLRPSRSGDGTAAAGAPAGGSDFCPNAFFTIDDRVLGMQAHPEFSTAIMQDVLSAVEAIVEPACHAQAKCSLDDGPPDNELAARWVVDFGWIGGCL